MSRQSIRSYMTVLTLMLMLITTSCSWGQLGHDASRSGWAAAENTITPANVSQLQLAWSAPSPWYAGAYLANGLLYSIDTQTAPARLVAFSADGTQGCGGTPRTCTPQWSAPLSGALSAVEASGAVFLGSPYSSSSVAVVGNDVLVASRLATTVSLEAFDARGITGCSGVPKTCAPRWRAQRTGHQATVAVADGTVFMLAQTQNGGDFSAYGGDLSTYAVDGSMCGANMLMCTPKWAATTRSFGYLAVGNGRILVSGRETSVYDVAGANACGSASCPLTAIFRDTGVASIADHFAFSPGGVFDLATTNSCPVDFLNEHVCPPIWKPTRRTSVLYQGPNVTTSRMLMAETLNANAPVAPIRIFDRARTCPGTPPTCEPMTDLLTGGDPAGVSVTKQMVFAVAGATSLQPMGTFSAFALDQQSNCVAGAIVACSPLWQVSLGRGSSYNAPPIVSGRLVAVTGGGDGFRVYALPA